MKLIAVYLHRRPAWSDVVRQSLQFPSNGKDSRPTPFVVGRPHPDKKRVSLRVSFIRYPLPWPSQT
jgi:hypothetical protein